MNTRKLLFVALTSLAVMVSTMTADAQTFILDDSGLIRVDLFNVVGGGGSNDNDLNSTLETRNIWNYLDANPNFTGTTPNLGAPGGGIYNVANNVPDVETRVNYDAGGNFGADIAYNTINNDGPGGGVGPINGGDDFSVRGRTILEFTVGGQYVIGAGSDDGRLVALTEALPGSAPGYSGITATAGQITGGLTTPSEFGFDPTTGHNNSRGEFTVAAGDILALDSFFYERGGGDDFEIFLNSGPIAQAYVGGFQLLTDGLLGVQLHTNIEAQTVPEPSAYTLGIMALASFGMVFWRRRK